MSKKSLAYWVDLSSIQFQEDKPNASWLQAFPVGEYKHPLYGTIKMTFDIAKRMASNVIQKVRGIDIAIDFGHNAAGEAAGWVSSAEARKDGLWLFVEWTADAAEDIRSGKYRYFSPEYLNKWKDPQTGKVFKDVLIGGGLTNRPFLKNISPVNLSEILDKESNLPNKGGDMEKFLKELRDRFKLAEDADEETILKALNEALQVAEEEEEEVTEGSESLSEDDVKKIVEEYPGLASVLSQNKTLSEQNKTLVGRVLNLEIVGRNQSISVKLTDWHAGGETHKFGLPTVLDEKVTSFMLSVNEEQTTAFVAILDEMVKTGMVALGEKRTKRTPEGNSTTIISDIEVKIKKLMEDEKLEYADASAKLFRDDEDLYTKYLAEITSGEGEDE